jgi:alkylation response protein AidB-like acyl-CoA dehydrogenase
MRFHLTEEQDLIQDSIRRTLEDVCPPDRRRAAIDGGEAFDRPTWEALMALGVGGLALPEALGGAGLGLLDAALAVETIGRHAAPGPYLSHILAGLAVCASGDAAVRETWLPKLALGEVVGTVAFSEHWTPESWTLAFQNGVLTGRLDFAPAAANADIMIVGVAGGGLVLVERDAAGVAVEPRASSDLTRSLARVTFDKTPAVEIAAGGASAVSHLFDAGLVLVAADALGGADQCLAMSVGYAKTREQFGVVIGQFQALKHQLANMALEVEPARALVWYAAYAADAALEDASRAAAHAKAHLCDRFVSVTRMAIQAHGGIGYTWDYDLQLWFRRSLFDRAWLGSPALHRERCAVMAGW